MLCHSKHAPPIDIQTFYVRRTQFCHHSLILTILHDPILQEQQQNQEELMKEGDTASHKLIDHYMLNKDTTVPCIGSRRRKRTD